MDCEKLLLAMKKWGYKGVAYRYLEDAFGVSEDEAIKCAKKVGVDVGYGVLLEI